MRQTVRAAGLSSLEATLIGTLNTGRKLTARQQRVYDLICESIQKQRRPPSVRELMRRLGMKSPNGIASHLVALEKKGYIDRETGISRNIRVTDQAIYRRPYSIPIVGRVSAGQLLAACELLDWLSLGDLLGDDCGLEAVQVEGNGMMDQHIADGDFLIRRDGHNILLWRPMRL